MTDEARAQATDVNEPHFVTLLGLCNDLLRRRWASIAIVFCCAAASALFRLAQPRTYTAVASFVPDAVQPLRSGGDVPSAATLLGLGNTRRRTFGSTDPIANVVPSALPPLATSLVQPMDPSFYWRLLRSREILMGVAAERFSIGGPGAVRTGTAADIYRLPPGPALRRTEDAARRIGRSMEVTYTEQTGVLTLSVRTFDPSFAREIAEHTLDALPAQNRRMAESRGTAQVAFLARAADEARRELTTTQDELAHFLASNRAFVPASPLALEYRRRDADVLEKRRHYAELALQLERAKLDRSSARPTIAVVQRPETPAKPDPRGVLRGTILGMAGGIALTLLLVLTGEQLARLRASGFQGLSLLEAEWRTRGRSRRAARTGRPERLDVLAAAHGDHD